MLYVHWRARPSIYTSSFHLVPASSQMRMKASSSVAWLKPHSRTPSDSFIFTNLSNRVPKFVSVVVQ